MLGRNGLRFPRIANIRPRSQELPSQERTADLPLPLIRSIRRRRVSSRNRIGPSTRKEILEQRQFVSSGNSLQDEHDVPFDVDDWWRNFITTALSPLSPLSSTRSQPWTTFANERAALRIDQWTSKTHATTVHTSGLLRNANESSESRLEDSRSISWQKDMRLF